MMKTGDCVVRHPGQYTTGTRTKAESDTIKVEYNLTLTSYDVVFFLRIELKYVRLGFRATQSA